MTEDQQERRQQELMRLGRELYEEYVKLVDKTPMQTWIHLDGSARTAWMRAAALFGARYTRRRDT